jgi:hypothetical protein
MRGEVLEVWRCVEVDAIPHEKMGDEPIVDDWLNPNIPYFDIKRLIHRSFIPKQVMFIIFYVSYLF